MAGVIALAILVLLAAACSGGGRPLSAASGRSPGAGGSTNSPSAVGYSRCMRLHGVSKFPDPAGGGQVPKADPQQLGVSESQLRAAQHACQHLYPAAGGSFEQRDQRCYVAGDCPPDIVQKALTQLRKFAQCIRNQGVPNFPDPTSDAQGHVGFHLSLPAGARGDPYRAQEQACEQVMHPEPAWGTGL